MKYLGYLVLNPWIAAFIILFLDAMPIFMDVRLKPGFENGKFGEDEKKNILSVIKSILLVNAVVILSYLIGGHYGGSIVLFIVGILVYVYEVMDYSKKRKSDLLD